MEEATIPQGATMESCTHKRLLRKKRERRKRQCVICGVREGDVNNCRFTKNSESKGEVKSNTKRRAREVTDCESTEMG